MRATLLLTTALVLTAVLAVGQPPTGTDRPADRPGAQPATPGASAADRPGAPGNVSLDGSWTVISLEKNGQPVPNAQNMTVMVKGNTVTFDAGKATGQPPAGQNQLRAMRLDFGRDGKVYVTEANAEGKFDTGAAPRPDPARPPGTPGVDRPSTKEERQNATGAGNSSGNELTRSGAAPPRAGETGRPGEPAIPAGTKAGVYVLTQDYFAVCIHEETRPNVSPGGGDRPGLGTDRPGATDRPAPAPGAGADRPQPGVTPGGSVVGDPGTNTRPGAAPPADRPGAAPPAGPGGDRAATVGGMAPQNRSYCTVILRRANAGAAPGGTNPTPNPDR